jgi:tetratricopeptide (TPR) repeat protein
MVADFRRLCACVVAVGPLLLAGTFEGLAAADDSKSCANDSGDVAIAACSRAIKSGRFKGHELARQYLNRGAEWESKKDYDHALADYGEAIRIDKKYADAFYDRCIIYNLKEDYDRALVDCSQAIKLGPSPNAIAVTGGERLGNDRTSSDYYSQRGLAYLKKKNYDLAIVDFDNAIRLYPKNAGTVRNRGLAYEAKGDTARAEADFEAAKQIGK